MMKAMFVEYRLIMPRKKRTKPKITILFVKDSTKEEDIVEALAEKLYNKYGDVLGGLYDMECRVIKPTQAMLDAELKKIVNKEKALLKKKRAIINLL